MTPNNIWLLVYILIVIGAGYLIYVAINKIRGTKEPTLGNFNKTDVKEEIKEEIKEEVKEEIKPEIVDNEEKEKEVDENAKHNFN